MTKRSLKDCALRYECAEQIAKCGIQIDFIKEATADFLSYKSNNEVMPSDELEILTDRYQAFQQLFESIISNN